MDNRLSHLTYSYDTDSKAHAFAAWASCLAAADGSRQLALATFETRHPQSKQYLPLLTKAAVAAGTTNDATWAAPLALAPLANAFLELVRPRTVLGQLVGARRAPVNVRVISQSVGTVAGWVGEGKPTPTGALAFTLSTLRPAKLGLIVLITSELVRSADPAAQRLVEQDLVAGVAKGTDLNFLNPAVAAVANLNPASITYGTTNTVSSGTTAAAVEADLAALIASVNGGALVAPLLVMKPSTALVLARLRGSGGDRIFPDLNMAGGNIWGIPVVVTLNVGNYIVLIEQTDVVFADNGMDLDTSTEATVQMDTAPDDPTTETTVAISLYQQNLTGMKILRYVSWAKRSAASAGYISGVTF